MKATVIAPSNIAFIKYWGKRNEKLKMPLNGSISMNLSNLLTTTTVEFNPNLKHDVVTLRHSGDPRSTGRLQNLCSSRLRHVRDSGLPPLSGVARMTSLEMQKVIKHLDRIRSIAKINYKANVVSENNFPPSTGLSSSASGFAALTLAASNAAGLNLSEKELSILARMGSGSSCRSILNGFVEWLDGNRSETSYAVSLFPPNYWEIVDVVAIISKNKKEVSTTEGQKFAKTSPFFRTRMLRIKEKIRLIKKYIEEKNFTEFGELVEQEALEFYSIMLTSTPPLIYWLPETIKIIREALKWRKDGIKVYFTLNTGQNIHLICQKKDAELVSKKTSKIPEVKNVVVNAPSIGAHIVSKHLF